MSLGRALDSRQNGRGFWWVGALLLLAGCGFYARIAGTAQRWIFVANFADDTVSVIDGALDREIRVIPVGRAPASLALRHDDYVCRYRRIPLYVVRLERLGLSRRKLERGSRSRRFSGSEGDQEVA